MHLRNQMRSEKRNHSYGRLIGRPYLLFAVSFGLSLLVAEVVVRSLGNVKTFSERAGAGWSHNYSHETDSHYHLHPRSSAYHNSNSEFSYLHTTNALGCVGPMPETEKKGKRIVFFGDSFTEGVGAASPDSSCPKLLEDILSRQYPDEIIEVLNFGVGGNDVVFAAKYLMDSTARFQPDLVIMMFNNTDVFDIIQRGGWERFQKDGTTRCRSGPWFLPLFRYSHLVRLVVVNGLKYDAELLMPRTEVQAEIERAHDIAVTTAMEAKHISNGMEADFLFVLMPFWTELTNQRKEVSKQFTSMTDGLNERHVNTLNLFETMSVIIDHENFEHYSWWKYDGHYKHTGYPLMAEIIANSPQVQQLFITSESDFRELSID